MRPVKLGNALLWVANVTLGAAIVVFAFQFLLFRDAPNPTEGVTIDEGGRAAGPPKSQTDYSPIKNVPNPVEPRPQGSGPSSPSSIRADLQGTNQSADPAWIFAFLSVSGKGVTAFYDEPVTFDGSVVADLAGWKLKKVTATSATFSNGTREETLTMTSGASGTAMTPGAIGPIPGGVERGKVQALSKTNDREHYSVDRNTAQWAIENQEKILSEIALQDYTGGGIQITSIASGSIAGEAGLQQYDVIKSLNGQPVTNSMSLNDLKNNAQLRNQNQLVITVERGGTTKTIVIQPSQK